MLPKDPIILLSTVNMKLRDFHPTLEDLCQTYQVPLHEITETLAKVNYHYDKSANQFK